MSDFCAYSSKLRPWRWLGRGLAPALGWLLLAACSPLGLLRPGQRLLSGVEVKGVALADKERLTALAQQKPNNSFPLPKLAIYGLGYRFYDSVRLKNKLRAIQTSYASRMKAAGTDSARLGQLLVQRERKVERKQAALDKGNAIMRLGEAPVVYDSALTRRSVEQMTTYLRSQGYFRARVTATDTTGYQFSLLRRVVASLSQPDLLISGKSKKRVVTTYTVAQGRPFLCRLQPPSIPDSGVAAVVRQGQPAALLHENERYNEELIGQERARLETLLKNAGYFDFRPQFVTLEADTSYEKFTVRLRTLIANPAPGQGHRRYTLRQVRFVTDAGVSRASRNAPADTLGRAGASGSPPPPLLAPNLNARPDTTVTDSVHFAAYQQKYSTHLLVRKVLIRPGQPYSLTRTLLTQRLLSDLDMFRFNTVNYRKVPDPPTADSTGTRPSTGELMAIINASPAPKFQETTEFGGTYVAALPGPFINLRLKTRNPFGGAEVLEVGVRAGIEGQLTRVADNNGKDTPLAVYTTQLGATAALVLPQFLVPFRSNRFLTRYNPKTRFSLSETFVDRPEYTRSNFEFTFDYIWQKSAFHQYVFSPAVLTLVNTPAVSDSFQVRLIRLRDTKGSSLYRSFNKQIEPSINFTSLYNSNDFNQTRDARYLRLSAEVGGLTRELYRAALFDRAELNVYDFARLSVDYRRYHHLTPKTFFVWRLNGGVVHALTTTQDPRTGVGSYVVPYDKSFFAGGSTSLRAWQPRRLGPGGYTTLLSSGGRDEISEQPGELLLEGSAEYRFPIYSFIKGAFFTDFGNAWGLQERKDDSGKYLRPGAQFQLSTFYQQIAVDAGLGIRFDFSVLILRLDVATKVYDPTATRTQRWAWRDFDTSSKHLAFNVGIGYPF